LGLALGPCVWDRINNDDHYAEQCPRALAVPMIVPKSDLADGYPEGHHTALLILETAEPGKHRMVEVGSVHVCGAFGMFQETAEMEELCKIVIDEDLLHAREVYTKHFLKTLGRMETHTITLV
jgi:hypothetical protein